MIASHYAEPVARRLAAREPLRSAPGDESTEVALLEEATPFLMLDDSLGWAWGYAGDERRVGYVRSEALAA